MVFCQVCDRSYLRKDHLSQHIKVHDESKAFKCDVCLKNLKAGLVSIGIIELIKVKNHMHVKLVTRDFFKKVIWIDIKQLTVI